jgi:hypothetical protein
MITDNEFQSFKDGIEELGLAVNVVSKNEHVPEVKRQNRVIKERARTIVKTLPYKKISMNMSIALIQYAVVW